MKTKTICHNCGDPYLAAEEEPACREALRVLKLPKAFHVLDVGCGDSGAGERIVRSLGGAYTGIDRELTGEDYRSYQTSFIPDVVMFKRALCQNDRESQLELLDKASAEADYILICEPLWEFRPRGLPPPPHNQPVNETTVNRRPRRRVYDRPVALDYVYWTRFCHRGSLAYDNPLRHQFPRGEARADIHGLYRVQVYAVDRA